jgi:DNA polymerase I-like protein with 3'-5' exonuclease and polymerase domains
MELRAAAEFSGDPELRRAFREGVDPHRLTASDLTGKPIDQITDEERKQAKSVNFGVLYGMGPTSFSSYAWSNYGLIVPVDTAREWIARWNERYAGYVEWRLAHFDRCEAQGYVRIGRHADQGQGRVYRWAWERNHSDDDDEEEDEEDDLDPFDPDHDFFNHGHNSRVASWTKSAAFPVQGLCADIGLHAIAAIEQRLRQAGIAGADGLIGWIHDEYILEVAEGQAEGAKRILEEEMTRSFLWAFPDAPTGGLVEAHIGQTWADSKSKKAKA